MGKPTAKSSGKVVGRGRTGGHGAKPMQRKKKSKLVVTFDPEKRKEYLTGFHKRKQERRRFGLDMEAFKQKKRLMEAKKQRREEQKEQLKALNIDEKTLVSDDEEEEEEEEEEEDGSELDDSEAEKEQERKTTLRGKTVTRVMTFDDEHTQGKFGDVVTVTTSVGDLKSDTEDELGEEDEEGDDKEQEEAKAAKSKPPYHQKPKEKQLTMFQRIQLKRKGKALPSKRAKLKEARASRKAMGLHGKKGGASGGKHALPTDGDAATTAKALLKQKRGFGGGGGGGKGKGKKRHKKH